MSTEERIKQEAGLYLGKLFIDYGDQNESAEKQIFESFEAGALSERNKVIEDAKQKFSELGFTIDDYNGRLIFNTLESLKV